MMRYNVCARANIQGHLHSAEVQHPAQTRPGAEANVSVQRFFRQRGMLDCVTTVNGLLSDALSFKARLCDSPPPGRVRMPSPTDRVRTTGMKQGPVGTVGLSRDLQLVSSTPAG